MKAGKIIAWVAGIGAVGVLAAFALYKPRGVVIWDTKSQTGSVTLGSDTVAFSPTQGSATAKAWNGYQLSINVNGASPIYTFARFGNIVESGSVAQGNTGGANISVRVT